MPKWGIVVIHYHREHELDRLLGDLIEHHGVAEASIIVVDNGSDDALVSAAMARGTRWLHLDNPGYGAAANAGVASLPDHDRIVILTHETVVLPGALPALAAALDDPCVTIAGPVLRDSRTGAIWSAGGSSRRFRALPAHHGAGSREMVEPLPEAEWLDGSCLAVRRATWLDVGGMDERYFLYFEDVDLGWRVRSMGGRVVVVPEAVVTQSPGDALDQYLATRNTILLFRSHRRRVALALFVAETLARLSIGSILRPRGASGRAARRWAGLRDGLAGRGGPPRQERS